MANKKTLIFAAILIVFLVGITATSATDDVDTQVLSDNSNTQDVVLADSNAEDNIALTDNMKEVPTVSEASEKNIKKPAVTSKEDTTKSSTKDTKKDGENKTYNVTNSNYNKYFASTGEILSAVSANSTLILSGEFQDKDFIITTNGLYVTGDNTTQINNGKVYIDGMASNVTVTNLKITVNNVDEIEAAIDIEGLNTAVSNNIIHITKDNGKAYGIRNNGGENATIIGNHVEVYGPSMDIDWTGSEPMAVTSAIISIYANNVVIANNTAKASKGENAESDYYGTIDAVELKGENITVDGNRISVEGARFGYAVNGLEFSNSNITNNKIEAYGERYIDGIQIGNGAHNLLIANNEITGVCQNKTIFKDDNEAMSFGIISTNMGGTTSENINITNNTINMNATIAYGMEIYGVSNNLISDNKLNLQSSAFAMGIGLAHSKGITINNNTVITKGNSGLKVNEVVEEIRPANHGIHVQQQSDNVKITNNVVLTEDAVAENATAVLINSSANPIVKNNALDTNTQSGADAIVTTNVTGATIENNTSNKTGKAKAEISIVLPSEAVTSTTIKIKANVINEATGAKVNEGTVVFKINGNTIKMNGKSEMKVTNGVAEVSYYLNGLTAKSYKITATYSGSDNYDEAETTSNLNVLKTNISFTPKTITGYSGETIKLNETLCDVSGKTLIGKNKIVIKLNGKTYYKGTIEDGKLDISLKLPDGLRAGVNNLTIIIGESNRYNQASTLYTINTPKQDTIITIEPVSTYGAVYTTFKATFKTAHTGTNVLSGKVAFKVNGKTIQNMDEQGNVIKEPVRVVDGVAILHTFFPLDMKSKNYNITVTSSGNNYANSGRETLVDGLTIL